MKKEVPPSTVRGSSLYILRKMSVLTEDMNIIVSALSSDAYNDLEDGLQVECAATNRLDYIVTRNVKDFKASTVNSISPEDFIAMHKNNLLP